jgi:hypothetical protein
MKTFAPIFAAVIAAVTTFGLTPDANADALSACGAFEFSAGAQCEMRVSGGCTTSCEPVSFTAECSAELYVGCQGQCNAQIEAGCSATCDASCHAQCDVDPGKFDCAASCRADCGATCNARCAGAANGAECAASCKATCGGQCDARCEVVKPSADCDAKCKATCDGSCSAKANMDCQIDCQSDGYVDCKTDLKGGCETACQRPEGALFCDNQFVDVGDQIDACVAELQAALQIEVTGYAEGNAECSGGRCTAEGEAGFSCMQGRGDTSGSALGVLGALAAFGLALSRRKK